MLAFAGMVQHDRKVVYFSVARKDFKAHALMESDRAGIERRSDAAYFLAAHAGNCFEEAFVKHPPITTATATR